MALKIKVYMHPLSQPWALPHKAAMIKGMQRHGEKVEVVTEGQIAPGCDLTVTWGIRAAGAYDLHRQAGEDVLVLEHGYMGDRKKWTSTVFNGLNGDGEVEVPRTVSRERFDKHFSHLLRPWRDVLPEAPVVLIGQVPGDASLRRMENWEDWYHATAKRIKDEMGAAVVFRPHPVRPQALPSGLKVAATPQPLLEQLGGARLAVAFNSNALVESVLHGVPSVSFDRGGMAHDICLPGIMNTGHRLHFAAIEDAHADPTNRPDRMPWASRLAWCQWAVEEMASGEAWEVLRQRYA